VDGAVDDPGGHDVRQWRAVLAGQPGGQIAQGGVEPVHVGGLFDDAQVPLGGAAAGLREPAAGAPVLLLPATPRDDGAQGQRGQQPGAGQGADGGGFESEVGVVITPGGGGGRRVSSR
jgi:hypothetical protein